MLDDILRLVSKLPPEALSLLARLVRSLLASKDPQAALRRAALAAASEEVSEAALRRMLRK